MIYIFFFVLVFFFKQKTAYEMRISDWSSDVCSSDLRPFCRFDDVEVSDILLEGLGIMRRDVPDTLGLRAGSCLHLVIARVGVGGQMANIGDVDDMGDIVTLPHQRPAQGAIGRASCRERVCQYA